MSGVGFWYDFEVLSLSDYSLELRFETKNRLLRRILSLSKNRMHGDFDVGKLDGIERIDIIPSYFKYIKNVIRGKVMNPVIGEVGKDGINIRSYEVVKGWFEREKSCSVWEIHLVVNGLYVDER